MVEAGGDGVIGGTDDSIRFTVSELDKGVDFNTAESAEVVVDGESFAWDANADAWVMLA